MERRAKSLFLLGFEQMISRLQPKMVLFHGRIPGEITTKMAAMYGENGPKLVPVAAYPRIFAYPLSVNRFITFERNEAQERAERDREQAAVLEHEQAMERLLLDRQRAEEAARQRAEALREKKIASARRTASRRKEKTTGGENK